MSIKIISFNIRGLGDSKKRKIIKDWIRCCNADIYFFQETKIGFDKIKDWLFSLKLWNWVYSNGNSYKGGLLTLVHKSILYNILHKSILIVI